MLGVGGKPAIAGLVEEWMPDAKTFDVSAAIEGQKVGRFTILLVVTSWLVTFFDGDRAAE